MNMLGGLMVVMTGPKVGLSSLDGLALEIIKQLISI